MPHLLGRATSGTLRKEADAPGGHDSHFAEAPGPLRR
jgi:hypothetical protein